MTGPQVSSLRALLMFFIRMGAEITGRDVDQPTSLAVTAAILSIYQPLYLLERSIFTFVWCNSWDFIIVSNF